MNALICKMRAVDCYKGKVTFTMFKKFISAGDISGINSLETSTINGKYKIIINQILQIILMLFLTQVNFH